MSHIREGVSHSSVLLAVVVSAMLGLTSFSSQAVTEPAICFDNPDQYSAPHLHYWNAQPGSAIANSEWPGSAMRVESGFFCFEFDQAFSEIQVVFNDQGGAQSEDIRVLANASCWRDGNWQSLEACGLSGGPEPTPTPGPGMNLYFLNDRGFSNPSVHLFNQDPAAANTQWPGLAMGVVSGDWYSFALPENFRSASVVISDSGSGQTEDLQIDLRQRCVQGGQVVDIAVCGYREPGLELVFPDGPAIYFANDADWSRPTAYLWGEFPEGSIVEAGWPGAALTALDSVFYYLPVGGRNERGNIIFSNEGQAKSEDLSYSLVTPCYRNGQWQTLQDCGVPEQPNRLDAGPDRRVNQNSRIALSASASQGDLGEVTWASEAWSGPLQGFDLVTPELNDLGSFTVTMTDGGGASDSFELEVVAPEHGLASRPPIITPFNFPESGSIASGNYQFEPAFPNLEGFFTSPLMVTHDGFNDLIYVVDKPGRLAVFPNEEVVTPDEVITLLDIRDEVRDYHEQGLLSVAFHPQFADNGLIYLYFIEGAEDRKSDNGRYGDGVLIRLTLNNPRFPTGVVPESRVEVLRIPQPGPDHKGGKMVFHPETDLFYMGIGDGGYAATAIVPDPEDPRTNNAAQDTQNLLGTFIRLEMLVEPENGRYYRIPSDNPFVNDPDVRDEIFSYGHRNPWRWDIDSQPPYTIWETEVGQSGFEEVNILGAGGNYGWPICEGERHRGAAGGDPQVLRQCTGDLVGPVEGYEHNNSPAAIVGGFVYRGNALSDLAGRFVFGDYRTKAIWTLEAGGEKRLLTNGFPGYIASFGTDLSGESILVSTHGLEFSETSGIYRIVDRQAQPAVIPSRLSETGLFADLAMRFPASGLIEYEVNAHGWFDGARARHFISVPNSESIQVEGLDAWTLPVGSVLVKHIEIPRSATQSVPFETSVLFRQVNGWEAANYRWNSDASDADLVTETRVESVTQWLGGESIDVERTVRTGAACGSCHTGEGSKNPRSLNTRQLNRERQYPSLTDRQLEVFQHIGLVDTALGDSAGLPAFVSPEDVSAPVDERARVYLDTNCASCHNGGLMDLRYDTELIDMDIMNVEMAANLYRLRPFEYGLSAIYTLQTNESNRMPRGSALTNPVAESLFQNWIGAQQAQPESLVVRSTTPEDERRVGQLLELEAFVQFNNGFQRTPVGQTRWSSTLPQNINLDGVEGASVGVVPEREGLVEVSAQGDGFIGSLGIDVLGGAAAPESFMASALSSAAISLNWRDNGDETGYRLFRSLSALGPFNEIVRLDPNTVAYVDRGLEAGRRYYYQLRAINDDGPSLPVSAFADTQAAGEISALRIETGSDVTLIAGERRQIVAIAERAGEPESATLSAVWSSDNTQIVEVSDSGVLMGGPQAGVASVTASFDGRASTVNIENLGAAQYVYFNNDSTDWENVRIHVFSTRNGNEVSHTEWPGLEMSPALELGGKWLRFPIPGEWRGDITEVIFNCASSACQTEDLELPGAGDAYFEDVNATDWLPGRPLGGGAAREGTQIVVGRGLLTWANNGNNLSGSLLTPGALVDIQADDPGTGQSFTRWEGTAAPYMLDPNSPGTQILVPDQLSLTINAVFDSVTDNFVEARELFRSSDLGCAGCHGVDGQGSPPLTGLSNDYTLASLANYISTSMPQNNPGACEGECAQSLAEFVLAEAFTPPAGICNFDDLDQVVPQDRSYRLLTVQEYNNAVRDLLGLEDSVDVTTGNLPDDIPVNGFKTSADTVFTEDYAQGYVNAASAAAALANNSLAGLAPECSETRCAIASFGRRAYRRPLTNVELDDLVTLQNEAGDRAVLITLFSSPAMLYRSEVGEMITSGAETGLYRLTDYEVATQLAFTYWATTPDTALLDLAENGELSTPEQIRTAASSMLADPRARHAFERFVYGWMDLEKPIGTNVLSGELKADMKEETLRFVTDLVFNGGSYRELLTANYSVMTRRLADHYGLPWPGGSGWQRVDYSGVNAERRGILGHASILSIQSAQEKTHPVKRGLFVRRNLMCQDFQPPPLGAALNPESDPSQGVRFRFETSHAQPGCEACHQYIDGIGFGLESYNAIGQYVMEEITDDGTVLPINPNGYIGSLNSAETFLTQSEPVIDYVGLDELSGLIADSSNGRACFARQWFRYARGRREAPEDSCTLQSVGQNIKANEDAPMLDLLIDYTQSTNFTLRK